MKKLNILFGFLLLLNFTVKAQWEVINEGPAVNDIYFTSANTGWMTGPKMLQKTSDGGDSWQTLSRDDDLYFDNVRFFNDTLGLAVACMQEDIGNEQTDYSILRSEDGGQSWQEIASSPGKNRGVVFVTDSIFFNYHDNTLFRTNDAGKSWFPFVYNVHFFDLPVFINDTIGFVSGEYWGGRKLFLRSIDSGESWGEMQGVPNDIDYLPDLQFVNDSTGYLVYRDSELYLYHLYVTTDTGRHWSTRYSAAPREYINTFGALSEDTLYAVFDGYEDTINWTLQTQLKISTDGGRSWNVIQELVPGWSFFYSSFTFDSQGKGYLLATVPVGPYYNGAVVLKQSREGLWKQLFSAYPFNALCFVSGEKGFAGGGVEWTVHGAFGDIFRTTDGGKSWELSYSSYLPVKDLLFTDELNGFALAVREDRSTSTSVLKTDNGGDSWYLLNNVSEDYYDLGFDLDIRVFFFNDNKQGWLAGAYHDDDGSGAIILGTTDGGQTWNIQWKYNTDNIENQIYDLEVVNDVVWAVGENGLIVKSVDSSSFTLLDSQTDLPLNKIFFTDKDHGWIAGGYYDRDNPQSVLLRTKDGGQNWQEYTGTEFLINDMFFEDSLHGWAAGSDSSRKGIILETVDGGENWLARVDGLRGELKDFYYKDSTLWAVGHFGLVLKKEGVIWTNINSGIEYHSGIQLTQNYPNPFTTKTIINYQLSLAEKVELSVFDLTGRIVATLVNKKQQAGSYEVEWNAEDLKKGIYIYRLIAGESMQQRKLILK